MTSGQHTCGAFEEGACNWSGLGLVPVTIGARRVPRIHWILLVIDVDRNVIADAKIFPLCTEDSASAIDHCLVPGLHAADGAHPGCRLDGAASIEVEACSSWGVA